MRRILLLSLILIVGACSDETPEHEAPDRVSDVMLGRLLYDAAVPVSLQDVLKKPQRAVLYTVVGETDIRRSGDETLRELPRIRDWYVYGKAEITTQQTETLLNSFREAVEEGVYGGKSCIFVPHHFLRVWKGDRFVDLIVCFVCDNFKVLPEGGHNNVTLSMDYGMEKAWRDVVAAHGLRDLSLEGDRASDEAQQSGE